MRKIFLLLLALTSTPTLACDDTRLLYKTCQSQQKIFDAAKAEAKASGQKLLVVLGAEWCPWCHSLEALLKGEAAKAKLKGFRVVSIGLYDGRKPLPEGRALAKSLLAAYGKPVRVSDSLPGLVLVEPKEGKVELLDSKDLRTSKGKEFSVDKLVSAAESAKL